MRLMRPSTLKMLIVDDDQFIVTMLQDFFKGFDYEFFTAADGEEALRQCIEKKPDFIITDIMIPKMTGIELIQKLRKMSEFAVTPIIAITAGSSAMQAEAERAGAHMVLEKPVRRSTLLKKVDDLLHATPFIPR